MIKKNLFKMTFFPHFHTKSNNFENIQKNVRISKKRPFLPGTVNHHMSFCTSTSSGPAGQIFMLAGHATTKLDPCLSVRIVNFSKKMNFDALSESQKKDLFYPGLSITTCHSVRQLPPDLPDKFSCLQVTRRPNSTPVWACELSISQKKDFRCKVRISKKRPFLPGTVNHDMSFCRSTSSGPAGQIFMLAGHATTKLDPCLSVRIVNFSKKKTFGAKSESQKKDLFYPGLSITTCHSVRQLPPDLPDKFSCLRVTRRPNSTPVWACELSISQKKWISVQSQNLKKWPFLPGTVNHNMSFCTSTSSGPAGQIFKVTRRPNSTPVWACELSISQKKWISTHCQNLKKRPFLPGTVNHDMSFCTSTSSGPAGQIFMLAGHATTKLDPCLSVRIVNFSKKMNFGTHCQNLKKKTFSTRDCQSRHVILYVNFLRTCRTNFHACRSRDDQTRPLSERANCQFLKKNEFRRIVRI